MPEKELILNKIKETVKQTDATAEVILFGSRARGDNKPDSDWDVLIVTDNEITGEYKAEMRSVLFDLQLELEIDVNYIFSARETWENPSAIPIYNEIKREGIRI